MSKVNIVWDMDGVLAAYPENRSKEQWMNPDGYLPIEECSLGMKAEKGIDFLKALLQDNSLKEKVHFLIRTSVWNEECVIAKKRFLAYHGLEGIDMSFVRYGESKRGDFGNDTLNILLDDYGVNLRDWEEGGDNFVSVKFYNGLNDRPKAQVDHFGNVTVKRDSWDGLSVSKNMKPQRVLSLIKGIISEFEENRKKDIPTLATTEYEYYEIKCETFADLIRKGERYGAFEYARSIALEDNASPTGGKDFSDETLADYLSYADSKDIAKISNPEEYLDELSMSLIGCGLMPVTEIDEFLKFEISIQEVIEAHGVFISDKWLYNATIREIVQEMKYQKCYTLDTICPGTILDVLFLMIQERM